MSALSSLFMIMCTFKKVLQYQIGHNSPVRDLAKIDPVAHPGHNLMLDTLISSTIHNDQTRTMAHALSLQKQAEVESEDRCASLLS
jgi:hypothetical protein